MCTEAFCEVLRCVFTCVRTCNCRAHEAKEEQREFKSKQRRVDLLLPSSWYFSLCTGSRTQYASSPPQRLQRAGIPS